MNLAKLARAAGVLAALVIIGYGCSTTTDQPSSTTADNHKTKGSVQSAGPYTVTLESVTDNGDGTWDWIWSIQNPNPGNGSGNTLQDLSHWTIDLGTCATIDDVVGAAYSGDGTNWTTFTPTWEPDPAMCNTCGLNCGVDVLKFDFGTTGSAKSYYRLTLNTDYEPAEVTAWYKSGVNTGCGTFTFEGIGCPDGGPGPQCEANTCENAGPYPYTFSDPSITNNGDGTWTWVWSVTNSHPGNGKAGTGTYQDMSHWTMPFNTCLTSACSYDESVIVGAGYSTDGVNWTNFTPTFAVEPSMCNTCGINCNLPVLKFNLGTTGSSTSYYRIVVNQNLSPQEQIAYYKSGKNTGCGCFNFKGLGCSQQ